MYCTLTPLLSAWNPWVTGRRASQSRLDFSCFQVRAWPAGPGPCRGEVNGAPAKLFSVPGASVKILLSCAQSLRSPVPLSKFCSPVRVACWSLSVLRRSQRRASKTFFGPRCLCQIFVTVGGVLVLVLVEERSAARQQNFARSPQIAMRPFSTANAAHTRRKFSTIVKIFAKSEQDQNSKLVALVFSLLQTDEILVNFCQLYFFGSWAEGKLIKLTRFRMLQ